MKLSKSYIDVGVQTNNKDEMLEFWQKQVGLPYEELLKVGGGTHQHRHSLNGSVFKLNHLRDPLGASTATGYQELLIASEKQTRSEKLIDPDGNSVTLVPLGLNGITHIGIKMEVRSLAEFQHFYRHILQIEELNETTFKWATTLFFLTENPRKQPADGMRGRGYRYLTVQVWDVDKEHQGVIDRGGREGSPPVTLGKVARISFIKDPDENWIEVSQRSSLTGELTAPQVMH